MSTNRAGFLEGARVILAIALKDSLDAVKDRKLLPVLAGVLMMIALFRLLPAMCDGNTPTLAVVNPGQSSVLDEWADSSQFNLHRMSSQEEMKYFLGGEETAILGLVVPPDFDQQLKDEAAIELSGYVDHWVSESDTEELQTFFETQLSALTSRPVHILIDNQVAFTHPRGLRPVQRPF